MNLLWIRPVEVEQAFRPDERRVRDYVDSPSGVSESVDSLSDKLGISRKTVETHSEHIKFKLGYRNAEALRRGARELLGTSQTQPQNSH